MHHLPGADPRPRVHAQCGQHDHRQRHVHSQELGKRKLESVANLLEGNGVVRPVKQRRAENRDQCENQNHDQRYSFQHLVTAHEQQCPANNGNAGSPQPGVGGSQDVSKAQCQCLACPAHHRADIDKHDQLACKVQPQEPPQHRPAFEHLAFALSRVADFASRATTRPQSKWTARSRPIRPHRHPHPDSTTRGPAEVCADYDNQQPLQTKPTWPASRVVQAAC